MVPTKPLVEIYLVNSLCEPACDGGNALEHVVPDTPRTEVAATEGNGGRTAQHISHGRHALEGSCQPH